MRKFVLVAIAALASLTLAACGEHDLTQVEVMTAENGARDYAERLGGKLISCSGLDSDGDNYTSCEVKDDTNVTKKLVCSYKAKGCKAK